MFAIDTMRLREINGEELLKQKTQCIIDIYLDSPLAPATQLDINHDMTQRLLKVAWRIVQGPYSPSDFSVFDDVRNNFFKELLPYWCGYKFYVNAAAAAAAGTNAADISRRGKSQLSPMHPNVPALLTQIPLTKQVCCSYSPV
jgi:hypothetical protein